MELGNESFPGALRSSYAPLHSRSRFIASLAMNIVRLMVFFVLGLLRGRCAAEQRDELAALHSITSSARASSVGGTSRPSALAVLRLMINSNLVDD